MTSNEDPLTEQSASQGQRGLNDGFERYHTPTDDDYENLLNTQMVVLDTNALLNLYRYTTGVRSALLEVLSRISAQLWEPDQVMLEFWRRRESAARDYSAAGKEFEKKLDAAKIEAIAAIRALANRIGLNEVKKNGYTEPLDKSFSKIKAEILAVLESGGAVVPNRNTNTDPILLALDPILRGRVGVPPDQESRRVALEEAGRRLAGKVPPGFKDSNKAGGNAEGDYLIWAQILGEAKLRSCDVLFVTGDVKVDWWRSWGGDSTAGPLFELLDEFHDKTGRRLFMLQPASFLEKAARVLDIELLTESFEQARSVDERAVHTSVNGFSGAVMGMLSKIADDLGLRATPFATAGHAVFDFGLSDDEAQVLIECQSVNHSRFASDHLFEMAETAIEFENARNFLFVLHTPLEMRMLEQIASLDARVSFVLFSEADGYETLKAAVIDLLSQSAASEWLLG